MRKQVLCISLLPSTRLLSSGSQCGAVGGVWLLAPCGAPCKGAAWAGGVRSHCSAVSIQSGVLCRGGGVEGCRSLAVCPNHRVSGHNMKRLGKKGSGRLDMEACCSVPVVVHEQRKSDMWSCGRDKFGIILACPVLVRAAAGTVAWQRHRSCRLMCIAAACRPRTGQLSCPVFNQALASEIDRSPCAGGHPNGSGP